jgi:hypothetical protein
MDRWLTGAVVIVGCEPVVETNSLQMGTNEFFSYLVRLVANKRHLQSCHYSHQKLGRCKQSTASSGLSLTRRAFPSGIRDGGRREPRQLQACSLGRRNVCRDLAAVGIPRQVHDQAFCFLIYLGTPYTSTEFRPIKFVRDELAVPTQNRIGLGRCRHVFQCSFDPGGARSPPVSPFLLPKAAADP